VRARAAVDAQLGKIDFKQIIELFDIDEAQRHLGLDLELTNRVCNALSERDGKCKHTRAICRCLGIASYLPLRLGLGLL
jgi:hypothetical protein